ncbi:hypothetical protein HBZS_115080 [Helicobacter bizzozeronii CCUG 35545]|nr:hypothetical protein HBZS_115080 [Helicobacter bizzozeronii CCUG 35545]
MECNELAPNRSLQLITDVVEAMMTAISTHNIHFSVMAC